MNFHAGQSISWIRYSTDGGPSDHTGTVLAYIPAGTDLDELLVRLELRYEKRGGRYTAKTKTNRYLIRHSARGLVTVDARIIARTGKETKDEQRKQRE